MPASEIETIVSNEYNRLAPIYDRRWHNYLNNSLSFLLDFADIPKPAAILDLACGTGEFARLILETNPQQDLTGVDISAAMLAIGKDQLKAYSQVKLLNASATALPFDNECFDLVICANAFHYLESPPLALAEMRRVLKPKGTVIILDWCRDYLILKLCDRLFKILDPAYQQCYTQEELERLLIAAGFGVVKDSKVRFGVIWELMAIAAIVG